MTKDLKQSLNYLETEAVEVMNMLTRSRVISKKAIKQTRRGLLFASLVMAILATSLQTYSQAYDQGYKLGVGIRLSNSSPTLANSLTAKYFFTDANAVEGLIAFGSRFGLGALFEKHNQFPVLGLSWLYGGGLYLGFEEGKTYFGPTGIVGIDYKFADVPINLTLDYKPELDLSPKARFIPDAFALSVRFTIK